MGFRKLLRGKDKAPPLLIGGSTQLTLQKYFSIVRNLGAGSYSTVYEAERLTDGQRYALKVTDLRSLPHLDKVAVVEEIRLLASLQHPNIISYYEAFCDHDKLCVVTELVAGGDLGTFISKTAAHDDFLWERQVWDFFLQAALGVQYLHHNHVLHRDLKPQNIMLTGKRAVPGGGTAPCLLKIVDLGVSAELALVFTNIQIGTPHYMAPEMWNKKAYSYSADIWALGCILHELCTLRPTFLDQHTRTEADIKARVLSGRYDPIPSRYSLDLSRLVGLMLQKDPRDRPTIDEILALPSVRSKFTYLPPELQQLALADWDDRAVKEAAVGELPDDIQRINCLLPPARYATGTGLASLLCGLPEQRRSLSLSDLLSAEAANGSGGSGSGNGGGGGNGSGGSASTQQQQQQQQLQQQDRGMSAAQRLMARSPSPEQYDAELAAGGGGGGMHQPLWPPSAHSMAHSSSMGVLEEGEGRLRRRSIMVGELLFRLHQQQEAEREQQQQEEVQGPEQRQWAEQSLRRNSMLEGSRHGTSPTPGSIPTPRMSPTHVPLPPLPGSIDGSGGSSGRNGSGSGHGSGYAALDGSSSGSGSGQQWRAMWAADGAAGAEGGGRAGAQLAAATSGGGGGGGSWLRVTSPDPEGSGRVGGGMSRASVAVAEVLLRGEATQVQLGQRGAADVALAAATPLVMEPFEFCANNSNNNMGGGGGGGSSSAEKRRATSPPKHRSSSSSNNAAAAADYGGSKVQAAASGSGSTQQQQQVLVGAAAHPPRPSTPTAASVSSSGGGGGGKGQQAGAGQKKKKKHGRLWRLMYGDHHDSGMHQDWA